MAAITNFRIVRIVPLLIAVWLVGGAASAETSTYVFVPDQSKLVQTGGFAGVHWTYSVKGQFQLTVDPNVGTASFAHVDANATDDSPFKRTLDPNHVFNMTSLVGTVEPSGSITFTGKASDDSDILITVTFQGNLAHLIGQTTPPPNSADFFIFSLDAVAELRKYSGGSGTAQDPYQIATADDLIALGETPEDYDKHFILTEDIDLDPNLPDGKVFDKAIIAPMFPTIAYPYWQGTPFTGVFDGKGHTISNLTITGSSYLGLFGQLGKRKTVGEVRNVSVVDANITGSGGCVAGLVGVNYGTVTQCGSIGTVSGDSSVGGLVGLNDLGSIAISYSSGAVSGNKNVGGLVGCSYYGDVTNCDSAGMVSGTDSIGGLVGSKFGDVTCCHSTATVSGTERVGGLVGINYSGSISTSYSTGEVSANKDVGGLVGWNEVRVTHCYSTGTVTGAGDCVGGLVGYNSGDVTCCCSSGAVTGQGYVGGLVGWNHGGDVTGCYSMGSVGGDYCVGGLVGENMGYVTGCHSTGPVRGTASVGGLVGFTNFGGRIAASYSSGAVSGTERIGGLVGYNEGGVTNCYSTGGVTGTHNVGGLVGSNFEGDATECYSTGKVVGTGRNVGGLVGSNIEFSHVNASFWDIQTSAQTASDGGTGKTTAEMQTASTFLEAGWDFVNVWGIGQNQTYPYLRKYSAADINEDASVNFLDLAVLTENWLAEGQ
jgi:hypothetical protein